MVRVVVNMVENFLLQQLPPVSDDIHHHSYRMYHYVQHQCRIPTIIFISLGNTILSPVSLV